MKRLGIILMFIVACATSALAQSYSYLTFKTSDGAEQSIAAAGLTITFSNGNLVATNGSETVTKSLSDLSSMFFSETATGISAVAASGEEGFSVVGGKLVVNAGTKVSVYTADGRRVANTQSLSRGIYLVRANGTTTKVTVK